MFVVEWGTTKTKKVRLSWNISWNAEVLNIRFQYLPKYFWKEKKNILISLEVNVFSTAKVPTFSTILSALSFFGILSSFKMCIIIFCLSTLLSVCFSISRYFLSGICGIDLFPSQTCNMASQRIAATLFQRTIFWDAWVRGGLRTHTTSTLIETNAQMKKMRLKCFL